MKAKILLRSAAGCLLFFATGHSIGHFTRHTTKDPQAQVALKAMAQKFDMFGQMRSYDENYTGMSFNLLITLLTLSMILWILSGKLGKATNTLAVALLYPIAAASAGFAITSFRYFFMLPGFTCLAASLIILYAIFVIRNSAEL